MTIKKTPLAFAVSTALALGSNAYAQGLLEEVVVTAQKREQSVSELGLSVTAFDGDTMRQLGMDQAVDLAAQTPGLVINNTMGDSQPAVMIRGIGISDFNTNTNPGVAVYVDQVATAIPAMLGFALYDMDRVEVLKGPQGTLYGQNTTGGAVSFYTKQPTKEFEGYVSLDVGNYDLTSGEAAVGGGLSENFRFRISGIRTQQDEGFQTDLLTGEDVGGIDRTAGRIQVAADFGDNVDATLRYSYGRDKSEQQTTRIADGLGTLQYYYYTFFDGTEADIGHFDVLLGDNESRLDNKMDSFGLTINADLGATTLTSVTGYDDVSHRNIQPFSGTELKVQNADYGGDLESLSQELRLMSNDNDLVEWIVGLYYSDVEQDNVSTIDFTDGLGYLFYLYGLTEFPSTTSGDTVYTQQLKTTSIFAHTEWNLSDSWTLTLAGRAAKDKLKYDVAMISPQPACDGPLCDILDYYYGLTDFDSAFTTFLNFSDGGAFDGVRQDGVFATRSDNVKETYFTWRAGLDFVVNDNMLLYGNVSNGSKAHGFYGGLASTSVAYSAYLPEDVMAYELGIKAGNDSGTLNFTGAVFYYDYKDQQILVDMDPGIGLPNPNLTNISKSAITGAEFDITWAPTEGLTTRWGATWLDTEIKDGTVSSPLPVFPGADPVEGAPLAYAPELSLSGLIRYDFQQGSRGGAYAQIDGDYADEQLSLPGRADSTLDKRTIINARVGYNFILKSGTLELALWGRNIADEEYTTYRYNQLADVYNEHIGAPRTYGISARYNF